MDAFVYFSHALVSPPSVGWIDAGHTNGVPVLGTFIMEWQEGAKVAARVFSSRATAQQTALQLAVIARWHGFDGWLVRCLV
jgi:mannosyl-glycoprotein endo-beta-N-acetylglucosaminidase